MQREGQPNTAALWGEEKEKRATRIVAAYDKFDRY
jgi:hypothetical protein